MLHQPALPASTDIARSPSFSLGTALMWLGHDCPGSCPPTVIDAMPPCGSCTSPERTVATWTKTLVDVDVTDDLWPNAERDELLSRINRCVQAAKMQRTDAERATFFAVLTARRGRSSHPQLVTAALATNLAALTNVTM